MHLLPASKAAVSALEILELPAALDGHDGANRALGGRPQIDASNDLEAVMAWLARVESRTTFENYRKEAERLLLWSVVERNKPLSSLRNEDFVAYRQFLANPTPAERWIMAPGRRWSRHDPRWRPFAGGLSHASQRQALVIINALFAWLVNAGYLAGNPLSLSRNRRKKSAQQLTRYLPPDLWQEAKNAILAMPQDSPREQAQQVRSRWLFTLLFICGLRISEVTGNTMGDFFVRRDKTGAEHWWLNVTGKGDKDRAVPATKELMRELQAYRCFCGLSPMPQAGESTPLLLPLSGPPRPLTRSAVHILIKHVFENAARALEQRDAEARSQAELLRRASAHWIRHTAGSAMADGGMDIRHIRDNYGHESISTTNIYVHSEDDRRHDETEGKHTFGW